jgi:hypothetical protein
MGIRLKELLLVLAFLLAPVFLSAQDDFLSFGDGLFDDGTNFPVLTREPPDHTFAGEEKEPETSQEQETPEEPEKSEKKKFRVKNRTWELSLANISFDFANNFVAASEIVKSPFYLLTHINDIAEDPKLLWQDPIVVDLDRVFDGFKFNFGASIKPFSFNFNWKDKWGVGLDIAHIDITGNVSLSGNLATMSEAVQDKFGVGGAAFVEVGIPVFFHYRDFKIKLRPAAYVPLVYTEPKVTYTFTETFEGTRFEINYDMRIYSLARMESTPDDMPLTQQLWDDARDFPRNNMGYDFGLSVEYPWRDNIDIGVDMANIPVPFAAAKLYHYMHIDGSVWMDTGKLDIATIVGMNNRDQTLLDDSIYDTWEEFEEAYWATVYGYPEEFTAEYKINTGGKKIYRPFMMVFYANYRPYESRFLTLIPSLGFSINYLYTQVAAIEGGLTARFDAANLFITTLGIHYNDRRWKNSIDFILNLRAFEFDFGLSLQSQDFARSWQGAGLGVNIGVKFGW